MPNGNPPLTEQDRQRVRELHAQGLTRNEIGRAIGRSASTVSKLAKELGLTFDRSKTRAATEAKVADAKSRRAALALNLLGDAERIREQLWQPCRVYSFGGRDNVYSEEWHERPDFAAQLKILQATGVALDKVMRIEAHDADTHGLAAVDQWLRDMIGD
ncbi:hypothetical protein GCM10010174_69980 [Kutzneria viridogrisea]|uniref:Transposase IS30-like HTH domain-containing protein n=1 Tax=Kutzneria viridogrisea TaxID=47990 RepID=A0ABR6BBQ8_9PSEU|nr:hypothetical protein [Kutzneria viridogrisea]